MSTTRFLLGIGVGVGLGLLFAPASGEETRQTLADQARNIAEISQRKVKQTVEQAAAAAKAKAGDLGRRVGREPAEAAVDSVREDVLGKNKTA
jgi:gas vesicle protein